MYIMHDEARLFSTWLIQPYGAVLSALTTKSLQNAEQKH